MGFCSKMHDPVRFADTSPRNAWGGIQDLPVRAVWSYIRPVTGPDPLLVFDRAMLRRRRERAAREWDRRAFLKRQVASRLVDRLRGVRRSFPKPLELGPHDDQ